jgi:hypothetical protein
MLNTGLGDRLRHGNSMPAVGPCCFRFVLFLLYASLASVFVCPFAFMQKKRKKTKN